jgi:polysaccharide export outer membrane protein
MFRSSNKSASAANHQGSCKPQPKGRPSHSSWWCAALRVILPAALLFALQPVQGALADYRLDSGDIIEVSVFGRNDLNRRTTVDVDGNVLVPLIGAVNASGVTLSALRTKIKELLATSDSVRGADVIVDLIECRPFYVYGNVARAGAYPYRPGMTARHALALAGGLDTLRAQQSNATTSPLTIAELRGRYRTLAGEYARQQIKVAALRAEAEGKTEIDLNAIPNASRLPGVAEELVQLETQYLKASQSGREQDKKHLAAALDLADNHVAALELGQKNDQEATKQQADELARVTELSRRGLASASRTTDEQRATVLLRSREMDTAARLAQARQARQEVLRNLEKADDRKVRLPQELQAAVVALDGIHSQLTAVGEQLVTTGTMGTQSDGKGRSVSEITIVRRKAGATVKLSATEDTPVEPDDIVEIAIKFDQLNVTPSN